MNKKAASIFLLLTIGTATAAIPLAAIIGGIVLGGVIAGSLEYVLGVRPLQIELAEVKQAYESYVLNDTYQDNFVAANRVKESHQRYSLFLLMIDDFAGETDGFAWSSMKRIYLDLRAQGYNHTYAKDEALNWLLQLYSNKTLTVQERSKLAAQVTCSAWETMVDRYAACVANSNCNEGDLPYLTDGSGTYKTTDSNLRNCTITYNGNVTGTEVFGGRGGYSMRIEDNLIGKILIHEPFKSPAEVYNIQDFTTRITTLTTKYNSLKDNAIAYFDALAVMEVNASIVQELLDPITMATQFSTGWNTTGYYRYAAAEAALTGVPVSLNSTVCFEVGNETYCGVMFTNWDNQTFALTNYTIPTGKWVYLLTEDNKLIRFGEGETFKIVNLTDAEGNPINSTVVYRYVEHSGDALKIMEELQKLNEIWAEYMKMQTLSGGGSSIGDWWAGLSDTEKLAIAGAAVLFIVLIARR